jgi:hypothetical protein
VTLIQPKTVSQATAQVCQLERVKLYRERHHRRGWPPALFSGISASPASRAEVRFLTFFDGNYLSVAETTLTLNGEKVDASTIWRRTCRRMRLSKELLQLQDRRLEIVELRESRNFVSTLSEHNTPAAKDRAQVSSIAHQILARLIATPA